MAPKTRSTDITVTSQIAKLASDRLTVHQGRCVNVRNRNAGCTRCAEVCTSGAISFEDGMMTVDAEKCIGCGTCATVCPTCALETTGPTDLELLTACAKAAEGNSDRVVIACARELEHAFGHVDESKVARVTCIGRVDESLICALAQVGAEAIQLVSGHCAACEHAKGCEVAHEVVASAGSLLDAWGARIPIEFCDTFPAEVRAEGFSADAWAAPIATDEAASDDSSPEFDDAKVDGNTLPKIGLGGTLPHHVPNRRGRLISSLRHLGEPADVSVESRLWGKVHIEPELCGSCRACTSFCPTGALERIVNDDKTITIEHTSAKCVKCRCCERICPKGALTIYEDVPVSDVIDVNVERFELPAVDVDPNSPNHVLKRMRGWLWDSKMVNFA